MSDAQEDAGVSRIGPAERWPWLFGGPWQWIRATIVLAAIVWALLTWRWFISPSAVAVEAVPASDAVVMFVGGRGERLDTALEVIAAGRAQVLVIPNGTTPTWPRANALCDGRADIGAEVLCPTPDPDTTRGEARVIAGLVAERGWESIVVVTSTYHLERATMMLTRCADAEVIAVDASPRLSLWGWGSKLAHEWAGVMQARLLQRGC